MDVQSNANQFSQPTQGRTAISPVHMLDKVEYATANSVPVIESSNTLRRSAK
jgi:hypothetical protein